MPSIQSSIFKIAARGYPAPFEAGLTIDERRARLRAVSRIAGMLPATTVMPLLAADVPAEWVQAAGSEGSGVIVYLHGGAYAIGSMDTHRDLAARLSQAAGMAVLLLEYRLAPEHPFPAALNDVVGAYQWLMRRGFPNQMIAFAGDSAGAGLALAATMMLRDSGLPLPACLGLIAPLGDLTFSGDSIVERHHLETVLTMDALIELTGGYVAGRDPTDPLLSPLFGDFSGLPPAMVQVGTDEMLYSDALRLAQRFDAEGIHVVFDKWEGMWHVFQLFARYVPEGIKALEGLGSFIKGYVELGASHAVAARW
jgi:acetyl esterase/lipase